MMRIMKENKNNNNKHKIKFNIKDNSQMPGISRFSPVSLAIGIRPGEICEILRKSKTAISAFVKAAKFG